MSNNDDMLVKRLSLSKIGDLLKDRLGEQAEDYVFPEDFEKAVVDIDFKAIVLEGQSRPYDAIIIGDVLADYRLAFENGQNSNILKSIQFVGNPTKFAPYGIYGNPSLTEINIPSSVTEIGNYGISYCTGLTSLDLSNVLNLGQSGLQYCTSLTYVLLNPNATLGNDVFSNCTGLTSLGEEGGGYSIELADNGGTTIPSMRGSKLQTVVVPDGYTSIGSFYNCTNLSSITVPDSVTTITTFYGCSSLTSFSANGVVTFNSDGFSRCTGLTTLYLPRFTNVTSQSVFSNLTSLQSMQIGSIGYPCVIARTDCFTGCTNPNTVVTCYTDENNLATNLTRIRSGVTKGTIIMKASADMEYNGTSYQAGDTVVTSTV